MFEIYTKENCSYCVQAKNVLKSRGLAYNEVAFAPELKEAIQARVPEGVVIRTVPQIFKDGEYIGGYLQLMEYLAANPQL
jgi:glutaredoxin 3